MTPSDELTAAADKLRTAYFGGAMTATPVVAALMRARDPIAEWLTYEADLLRVSGGETRGRAERALAVAHAINGSQP